MAFRGSQRAINPELVRVSVPRIRYVRDRRGEMTARALQANPLFAQAPKALLDGYARLLALSHEVASELRLNGLVTDGKWNPGIDVFRRLKLAECRHLEIISNIAIQLRQSQQQPLLDLTAALASLPRPLVDGDAEPENPPEPAPEPPVNVPDVPNDDANTRDSELAILRREIEQLKREIALLRLDDRRSDALTDEQLDALSDDELDAFIAREEARRNGNQ
jgi:hypothetical protein